MNRSIAPVKENEKNLSYDVDDFANKMTRFRPVSNKKSSNGNFTMYTTFFGGYYYCSDADIYV